MDYRQFIVCYFAAAQIPDECARDEQIGFEASEKKIILLRKYAGRRT